ncbi:predicted protein, partial [Nematostella vectensis]
WLIPGWYDNRWWVVKDPDVDCTSTQLRAAVGNYISTAEPTEPDDWNAAVISGKVRVLMHSFPAQASDVRDNYLTRVNQSDFSFPLYYPFGYDSTWAMALTLNASLSPLRAMGKSLESFSYGDNETADLFKRILWNTTFNGLTGKVRFDENGDRIGITHILQLQGERLLMITDYDGNYYSGGSPSKDRIDVEDMMFSVDARLFIVVTVFSFLGISFAAVCLSFNIYFREQRIVKMSSPRLNILTILGGITMYVAVVVFGVDGEMVTEQQGTILCQVR